jgi:hypothetical protein
MKIATGIRISLLISFITLGQALPIGAAPPIRVDTQNLLVLVDESILRTS